MIAGNVKPAAQHIAIFVPSLGGGGVERVVAMLANAFVERDRRVDVVLIAACGVNISALNKEVRIVNLGCTNANSAIYLARYLKKEAPDVILSTMDIFNVVASVAWLIAGRKMPLVWSSHTHMSTRARSGRRIYHRLVPKFVRLFYPTVSGWIAVSRGVAEDLSATVQIPSAALDIIHNPVKVPEEAHGSILHPHPWLRSGEPPVILSIGRLIPEKGHHYLLRAFSYIRRTQDVRLIVLGEGPERGDLEALAQDLGIQDAVDLVGFVADPFSYLRQARMFVLSSTVEGFGVVLVEALACGCAIVSTDCPGGPAEILDGGRFGKLVPVGDVHALAKAIEDTLGESPSPSKQKQRAAIFDIDIVAEKYLDVLDAAAQSNGA